VTKRLHYTTTSCV